MNAAIRRDPLNWQAEALTDAQTAIKAAVKTAVLHGTPFAELNRQIAVLAYQFGDGFSNLLWPTGACAIMCGIAKIPMGKWYKFFLPIFGIMFLLQSFFLILAVFIGYH